MNRWVTRAKPVDEVNMRLFCLPYAGGGASVFNGWENKVTAGIDICPVQLPGRENRLIERPFTDLLALAQALAQDLYPYLDAPFALFGHSMGALIAYELARELDARYRAVPRHLFVSAHRAPHAPNRDRLMHTLPNADFVAELKKLDGTPSEVLRHPELLELLIPALRADFTMIERYTHEARAPLDCPVTAFGAHDDQRVTTDDLAMWLDITNGNFDLRLFDGGHFYIRNCPTSLLDAISEKLTLAKAAKCTDIA